MALRLLFIFCVYSSSDSQSHYLLFEAKSLGRLWTVLGADGKPKYLYTYVLVTLFQHAYVVYPLSSSTHRVIASIQSLRWTYHLMVSLTCSSYDLNGCPSKSRSVGVASKWFLIVPNGIILVSPLFMPQAKSLENFLPR